MAKVLIDIFGAWARAVFTFLLRQNIAITK